VTTDRCTAKPLIASAGLALACSAAVPALGEPAFSYRSPFHAEQCDTALAYARQREAREPADRRARRLVAEALLCRGLDDDLAALDAAIAQLHAIGRDEPADVFIQLELADAVRKRFPLSDDAQALLRRARALLDAGDVGAARADLTDYIEDNLAAVVAYRARQQPRLAALAAAFRAEQLSAVEVGEFVSLLALTGPGGLLVAEERLNEYLAQHPDAELATLRRAELLRGRASVDTVRELYQAAERALCVDGGRSAATPPVQKDGAASSGLAALAPPNGAERSTRFSNSSASAGGRSAATPEVEGGGAAADGLAALASARSASPFAKGGSRGISSDHAGCDLARFRLQQLQAQSTRDAARLSALSPRQERRTP
jgi:tetratricopeptide (TPR) repeat protein